MSNSLNRVMLMGNLGANPELLFADSENPCLKLSLATTDVWRDKQQQRQERTEWHNVEMWGPRARSLSAFLAKGMQVLVDGSIRSRTVESDSGMKRRFTDIRARDLIVVSRKDRSPDARPHVDDTLPDGVAPSDLDDIALAS